MRAGIVQDEMQIERSRRGVFNGLPKLDKLSTPVAREPLPDYLDIEHVKGDKKSRRPMSLIVARQSAESPLLPRQARLRPVQCLESTHSTIA